MATEDCWLLLRNSLAHPPVLASQPERTSFYGACILQFEQLIKAAVSVASHAQPLPLYYAAMHGAKALLAAFSHEFLIRGHGLKQTSDPVPTEIMDFKVQIQSGTNVFNALASLAGSHLPSTGEFSLKELYLSLPDLADKPSDLEGPGAILVEEESKPLSYDPIPDPRMWIFLEAEVLPPEDRLLQVYPTLVGWHEDDPRHAASSSRGRRAHLFVSNDFIDYRDRLDALNRVAPFYRFGGTRWLRPVVGDLSKPLAPFPTWFALLLSFSLLARYEPDSWVAALDPRRANSVAITAALEEATSALPELVWKDITSRAY